MPADHVKAMTLRLPGEVHERLRQRAFDERTTVTALVLSALLRSDPEGTETEVEWRYGLTICADELQAKGMRERHGGCVQSRTVTTSPWRDA